MEGDTKKCYMCAENIPLDAKTCPYCGARYEVVARGYCPQDHEVVEAGEDGMCPKCGSELVDKQIESRYAGEPEKPIVTPVQASHTPAPPTISTTLGSRPTPKRSWAWLLLGSIGLMAIVAAIYILVSGVFSSKPSSLSTSLPTLATSTRTRTPAPTLTSTPTTTPTPLPVGAGYGSTSFEPGMACFGFLSSGLSCLDESGWHHYTPSNSALYGKSVYNVELCPDGTFVIVHENGIVFFDGQSFFNPLSIDWGIVSDRSLDCDAENNLVLTYSGSLRLYHQNNWTDMDISELAPPEKNPSEKIAISDAILDLNGALWVVGDQESIEGSIAKYENQSWIRFLEIPELSEDIDLHGLEVDSQGKIWAVYDEGLFSYDGQVWIHYPSPVRDTLRDPFIDSDDHIWITTASGFASFFNGGWNFYEIDDDIPSDFWPTGIALDGRGRLWLPTRWGLNIFDGERWITYHMHTSDIASNYVYSLAIRAGGPSLPALLEKEPGSISGRFFLSGQPLQEVDVEVCVLSLGMAYTGNTPCAKQPYFMRGKTDEEGRFTLTVPSGRYYLAFQAKGAEKWTRLTSGIAGIVSMGIDVLPGQDTRIDDIYLTE
jgi:hypothetical protein